MGSSLQSPFLPGGLIQVTLFAGKEGAGGGVREEVSWMVEREPSARELPTRENQGKSGAGPKPVRAPGDRPWGAQSLGRAGSGCRAAGEAATGWGA